MSQWHIRLVWHPDLPRSSGCSDSTFQFSLGSGYEINVRYLANHREPTTLFNVTFPYIFPNWQMDCMLPRFCSETDHKWRHNVVRAATDVLNRRTVVWNLFWLIIKQNVVDGDLVFQCMCLKVRSNENASIIIFGTTVVIFAVISISDLLFSIF